MTQKRPCILLVDDDPALRRFVQMALEDMPVDLVACDSVNAAVQVLQQGTVQTIVTDLMMPGESGLGLLQRLKDQPALRGTARVVILSAGLTTAKREQLAHMGVWSMLDKPVSVVQLITCMEEALAPPAAPAPRPEAAAAVVARWPENTERAHAQTAIDLFFAGNGELFRSYRASCLAQFPHDVQTGDAAWEALDLVALRHLAHNFKSVLRMLGYPALSTQAQALEENCALGQTAPAMDGWQTLRTGLLALGKP